VSFRETAGETAREWLARTNFNGRRSRSNMGTSLELGLLSRQERRSNNE
jgi:hypothetical protein